MSGFIAVIQNSFWETLDMKSFWVFLVLTVLASLTFGFIQFSPREDREDVAREAIVNVLNNSLQPGWARTARPTFTGVNTDQIEKTGPDQFQINFSWTPRFRGIQTKTRDGTGGLLPYLFTPAQMNRNAHHAGFGRVTFSEPELTVRVSTSDDDRTLERTRPVPLDTWNAFRLENVSRSDFLQNLERFSRMPEEVLRPFKKTPIHDVLSSSPSSSNGSAAENRSRSLAGVKSYSTSVSTTIQFTRTNPEKIPGGSNVSLRFISGSMTLDQSREDFLLTRVLGVIVPYLTGWFGVLLGLILTSNFIPVLLREGEIELLLTKQTPRWVIFLGRFLGAGLFFGLLTGIFLVLSSLILFLSTGVFTSYLLCSFIPLMLIFYIVYAMSAFIGMLTKSSVLSIIGSALGWSALWTVHQVHSNVQGIMDLFDIQENHWSLGLLNWLEFLLPSANELNTLTMKLLHQLGVISSYTINVLELGERIQSLSMPSVLLSSVGFVALFCSFSLVLFYRKEF